MKKGLILTLFLSLIFLAGCDLSKTPLENRRADNTQPVACSQEAKICPDGSTVGRTGPDCEFTLCPDYINTSTVPNSDNTVINKDQNCAKIGEMPNIFDNRTGKLIPGGKSCCVGLKAIDGVVSSNDKNICGYHSGVAGLCAPCGNSNCETKYGENHCSCPEDCK